jgi:hypothetical protein
MHLKSNPPIRRSEGRNNPGSVKNEPVFVLAPEDITLQLALQLKLTTSQSL